MKMPSVTISFTEAATAAVKRGERGIIAMILKDIVPAENPVRCVTEEDIPAELSEAGKQHVFVVQIEVHTRIINQSGFVQIDV